MGNSLLFGSKGPTKPHLAVGSGGLSGEINDLRADVDDFATALEKSGLRAKFFLNVATDAADADGIKAAFASAASPVTLGASDFDGVLAPGSAVATMRAPKRVTITVAGTGTPANWTGGAVVVTGTDVDGAALVETLTSAAGAGTTTSVGFFKTVTSVAIPAQGGTGASVELGVAADTASIASLTASLTAQLIDANSEFNRARIGNRAMAHPRRISFVFSNSADWISSNITLRGLDARGKPITETIAVPAGGNTTVSSSKFYSQVTSIAVPIQGGATGTCSVGFLNTELGLDVDPLSSVVAVSVVREGSEPGTGVWAVPTAGTVAIASTSNSGPYGKYTPNSAPDGARSYVLVYLPNPA